MQLLLIRRHTRLRRNRCRTAARQTFVLAARFAAAFTEPPKRDAYVHKKKAGGCVVVAYDPTR